MTTQKPQLVSNRHRSSVGEKTLYTIYTTYYILLTSFFLCISIWYSISNYLLIYQNQQT